MEKMQLIKIIILMCIGKVLFAQPVWQDNPGGYQFTATISGGIVLNEGQQMGDTGDIFAAFDDQDNVRGVATMLLPPFGPYKGSPVFEMQMRSNALNDVLSFRYYDASEDEVLNLTETYTFVSNDILGSMIEPVFIGGMWVVYNSDVDIRGFQFDLEGMNVLGASGGDAHDAGFMVSFSATTVLGFSLSGATIPAGEGVLVVLDVEGNLGDACLTNLVISEDTSTDSEDLKEFRVENCTVVSIGTPYQFQYNQSTLFAFYYFDSVFINDIVLEASDWVGAFNEGICVGSRQWNTSLCNSGVCDVPAMGDNSSDLTEGYMMSGSLPSFKIYDASTNRYLDATPSEEFAWSNFGQFTVDKLLAYDGSILGCMDSTACNYDPSANINEDNCIYPDENNCCEDGLSPAGDQDACGNCGGDCEEYTIDGYSYVSCSESTYNVIDADCAGECGGSAVEDECGICGGYGPEENYNCVGVCISDVDCAGVCGGNLAYDNCEVCGGNNSSCFDCADIANGSNLEDNCGQCDSDMTNDCIMDCNGDWGGTSENDECDVCGGTGPLENFDCQGNCLETVGADCFGNCGGAAQLDVCGNCNGNIIDISECTNIGCTDPAACNYNAGATDDSGNCNYPENNYNCNGICLTGVDCAGVCGGYAEADGCGVCGGNNSSCVDCAGTPNGSNVKDMCGVCDNDSSNDCQQDCYGIWGGNAIDDNCGICSEGNTGRTGCFGDDGFECDYNDNGTYDHDCFGNCVTELDCQGECDGPNVATFNCPSGVDLVCSFSDCGLDVELIMFPEEFGIKRIFPNPFNPTTQVEYSITEYSQVIIRVFDVQGREVTQLMNDFISPGQYHLSWNASEYASGMYFIEMLIRSSINTNIFRDVHKILYLK